MSQIKDVIQRIEAHMLYCKAKKIRVQEERREQREWERFKKYGCYGGKTYPWSKLYHCRCGNRHPWMHGFPISAPYNEIVNEETMYRVVCHRCFRHTKKGTFQEVVEEWNTQKGINYKKVIADWEGYPYIEPSPLNFNPYIDTSPLNFNKLQP